MIAIERFLVRLFCIDLWICIGMYTGGMPAFLIYFLTGGTVITAIVLFEQIGWRLLSGFATLIPVFTLIA